MKQKILLIAFWLISLVSIFSSPVRAEEASSAEEIRLNLVLKKYHSPMEGQEKLLIATAKKYNLDWTLIAAIAGTESSFGKYMPYQCINPFGWGIYGDHKLCFSSFAEAIQVVGQTIGTKYNTSSLETIARTYNPSHTQHWLHLTKAFISKIKNQPIPVSKLPLTL